MFLKTFGHVVYFIQNIRMQKLSFALNKKFCFLAWNRMGEKKDKVVQKNCKAIFLFDFVLFLLIFLLILQGY